MTIAGPPGTPPHDLLDGASLFLDFDGTLAELAPRPDAVRVDAALPGLLEVLACRLEGRMAIVSGRPVAQIRAYFPDLAIAVSGSHGLELDWPDGRVEHPERPRWLDDAVAHAGALRDRHPGLLVEEKPFGVALHYRQAPEAAADAHALADELARDGGSVQAGKMVVELRATGMEKGDAVRRFMQEPVMTGTYPVFLGDDLTDEPAFAVAAELNGAGILVGEPRDTAARYRLPGVAAVHDWLSRARVPA